MSSFSKQLASGPKDLGAGGHCRLLSGACQKEGSADHSFHTAAMVEGWSPNLPRLNDVAQHIGFRFVPHQVGIFLATVIIDLVSLVIVGVLDQ